MKRNGELDHSLWCRYRKDPQEEKAVRACCVYREFSSEAIRMVLPISAAQSERKLDSFVAALKLGLRKKFKGNPGHLTTTVYDEPIAGSESRRRYLVLFDGGPGGKGYLRELMCSLEQIQEVFQACECRLDSRKDGCYADCLEKVRINALLESEPWAGLLEVLASLKDGGPARYLSDHVVNGKPGKYLSISDHGAWLIEPQVDLGARPER